MKISAVVLTKNEEKNIGKCLKSLDFVDEIVIVDDESMDNTIELVHKVLKVHKVYKVFERKLEGDFASQRNFGMSKTSNEWVLFVDADEEVTDGLKKEIVSLLDCSIVEYDGYDVKRRDYFWNRELKYGETRKASSQGMVRLVKKGSGKWMGTVHEVFHTVSNLGSLNGYLNHYPHQTLKEFINVVNDYSSMRSKELFNQGVKTNVLQIILYPSIKFIYSYFILLGFLDGPAGFTYSFMMSFHSFLVRAKLYQLWQ